MGGKEVLIAEAVRRERNISRRAPRRLLYVTPMPIDAFRSVYPCLSALFFSKRARLLINLAFLGTLDLRIPPSNWYSKIFSLHLWVEIPRLLHK